MTNLTLLSKLLVLGALMQPLISNAQSSVTADRPTLTAGDTWTYRVLDGWSQAEQSQSKIVFKAQKGERLEFESTALANQVTSDFVMDVNLKPCRSMKNSTDVVCAGPLNFPLSVGQKTSYEKQIFSNQLGHATGGCTVEAFEKVTVPAGIFDAFKLECSETWLRILEGSGNGSTKYTLWYAPKVKRLVKVNNEITWNAKVQNKQITELVTYNAQ